MTDIFVYYGKCFRSVPLQMTTAHKPTWNSAQGSDEQGGSLRGPQSRMVSSKDLPGHTKLHYRYRILY